MTASESPGEQPPEDDTALLIAALNHAWAWYDTRTGRGLQVVNYFFIASAVLATAYVSSINGKHYPLAALVALAGIGLTAVTFLTGLRESLAAGWAEPVLAELQGRVAARLNIELADPTSATRSQPWIARTTLGRFLGSIAFGLALLARVSDDHAPCQGVLPGRTGFPGRLGPMT